MEILIGIIVAVYVAYRLGKSSGKSSVRNNSNTRVSKPISQNDKVKSTSKPLESKSNPTLPKTIQESRGSATKAPVKVATLSERLKAAAIPVPLDEENDDESVATADNVIPFIIEITPEYETALSIMEGGSGSVFITGKAGTGKSTLLKYFRSKTEKKIIVLAPTGIAAINVSGQTIHSFFKIAPKLFDEDVVIQKDYKRSELFKSLDIIIIDEISMVRADLMDAIDKALRVNRGSNIPFGGVQMVFFGDLYQLPPVVTNDLKEYFEEHFGSPYFFAAKVFKTHSFSVIELEKIFRQKDPVFISLLNNVREGRIQGLDISTLNKRLNSNFQPLDEELFITLASTNQIADNENQRKLSLLSTPVLSYWASVEGDFERKNFPTDEELKLKVGSQVMLLKNDPDRRWVNGSIGKVVELSPERVLVEVNGDEYSLEQAVWESIEYKYDRKTKKVKPIIKGSFTQFPLKLAWAVTIHKSQGKTFDKVVIDLGFGAFAHGQTYVALSRCTSFEGIVLKSQVRPRDIIVDSVVKEFMKRKNLN
ncbi:ATP-dependent DNA helicase [Algoriphagus sp. NG3]|uniref:ATP-dependent DNA helicase n=1 Tax=Algoriphagus sp. NG3 TaxID=3097546 RepID=UPI002A822764|nr:AAA family ATPase [Algoriphagus sp. NG3]WPR75208.1 AAA family ATPase [Algoriphagus sp. NG3]